MDFNLILFPAPKYDDNCRQKDLEESVLIPKNNFQRLKCTIFRNSESNFIPCRFIPHQDKSQFSDKIMLFFHGNAEDLSQSNEFLEQIQESLKINILAVEYPGYSFYKGSPSASKIEEDAQVVYDFLIKKGVQCNNIFVFGRSIGSGPATFLAKNNPLGLLILMSPFTSIKDVAINIFGKFLGSLVKQRFNNEENMTNIKCPVFIIHGRSDNLIPFKQSSFLIKACKTQHLGFNFPQDMTHNRFKFQRDIAIPLQTFMNVKQLCPKMVEEQIYLFLKLQQNISSIYDDKNNAFSKEFNKQTFSI